MPLHPSTPARVASAAPPAPRPIPPWAWHVARLFRSVRRLGDDYLEMAAAPTPQAFVGEALRRLGIRSTVRATELVEVPDSGPVVIVANHPFGGADGLVLLDALLRRRPDLRVLATEFLGQLAPLAPLLVPVDNFDRRRGAQVNSAPLRRALREVRNGGALLMFPAGVVSHLDLRAGCVVDPPWSTVAMRLLRATGAVVVPVHVSGRNSDAFQLAGVVHPWLRTLMLPAELQNKRGMRIDVRIGTPWPAARIARETDDAGLAAKLRLDVYALGASTPSCPPDAPAPRSPSGRRAPAPQPVADEVDATKVRAEVAALAPDQRLARCGALDVYAAPAGALRHALVEIGRLRELTFRAVGEGTGRAVDLDRFDRYYHHLFAWDRDAGRIAGAYRIGRSDEIRRDFGRRGLYVETLFELREPLPALLGPALELGRSFVRPEYQRSFAPLLALWRGIAAYVAREPRYARLIGPVSISAAHDPVSIELLVRWLRRHNVDPLLSRLVKARNRFRPAPSMATLGAGVADLPALEALSGYLAGRDPLGRGVPVLLRQYLKLGGRVLGFHVDADFGSCVDCLMLVDLRLADDAVLGKYMEPERLAAFRAHWARSATGERRRA